VHGLPLASRIAGMVGYLFDLFLVSFSGKTHSCRSSGPTYVAQISMRNAGIEAGAPLWRTPRLFHLRSLAEPNGTFWASGANVSHTTWLKSYRARIPTPQLCKYGAALYIIPSLRANSFDFPVSRNKSTQMGLPTPLSKCPRKSISSRQPSLRQRGLRGLPVLDHNTAHTG
jgi:hypothetical protein